MPGKREIAAQEKASLQELTAANDAATFALNGFGKACAPLLLALWGLQVESAR